MKLKYYLRGIGVGLILAVVIYSTMIIPRKYKMSDEEVIDRAKELGMTLEEETEVDLSALSGTPSPTGGITPGADAEGTPEATPEPDTALKPSPAQPDQPDEPDQQGEPSMPLAEALTPTEALAPTGTSTPIPTPTPRPTLAPTGTSTPVPTPTMPPTPTPIPTPTLAPTSTSVPTPTQTQPPEPAVTGGTKITVTVTKGMGSAEFARAAWKAGLVDDAEAFDKYLMQNGYASDIMIGTYSISAGASYEEIAKIITAK